MCGVSSSEATCYDSPIDFTSCQWGLVTNTVIQPRAIASNWRHQDIYLEAADAAETGLLAA